MKENMNYINALPDFFGDAKNKLLLVYYSGFK
jgi:hypothetical protein